MREIANADPDKYFYLSSYMDEAHLEKLKNRCYPDVIEVCQRAAGIEKITGNSLCAKYDVVKVLASLEKAFIDTADKLNVANRNLNEHTRLERMSYGLTPIVADINSLTDAIYHFTAAYYTSFEGKYYDALGQIVQLNKSPVISLNWDINFETVLIKKNPTIPMANYYGECVFNLLPPDQKSEPYNPLVNILKPHGSLNWLIPTGIQTGFSQSLEVFKENPPELRPGSHLRVLDGMPLEFNAEYQCYLIPPVPDRAAVNGYSGLFWTIKEAIKKDIFARIKEYSKNTRTLVIIGYSFPPEDEHIKNLFTINRFENVWVLGRSRETFTRIKGDFPDSKCTFFKKGFADILKWNVGEGLKPSRLE